MKPIDLKSIFRMNLVQNTILVIVSTLFTILTIDLFVFYVLDWKYPGYGGDKFYQFSELTGYIHKPGAKGKWYSYRGEPGHYVSINQYGFTDDEHAFETEKKRIAFLGDSVIQSWEMDDEYRPHRLLEKKVGHDYEVLNFGIRGYSLAQSYVYFQHVGVKFKPDIVVLNFCINDIKDSANKHQRPYFVLDKEEELGIRLENFPVIIPTPSHQQEEPKDNGTPLFYSLNDIKLFFYNRSITYRKLHTLLHGSFFTNIRNKLFEKKSTTYQPLDELGDLRPYKIIYSDEDQERLDMALYIILAIKQFMENENIRFVLVEGLDKQSVSKEWKSTQENRYGKIFDFQKVHTILENFAKRHDIPFLSLPEELNNSEYNIDDLMYHSDYVHFNSNGSIFFAGAVYKKLNQLQWIDKTWRKEI